MIIKKDKRLEAFLPKINKERESIIAMDSFLSDRNDRLSKIIEDLPDVNTRLVLRAMMRDEEPTPTEIAEELNIPVGTVTKLRKDGIRWLQCYCSFYGLSREDFI